MIPVILIHLGDSDYLHHTFARALQMNREVILIGNSLTTLPHEDVDKYKLDANVFEQHYRHLSGNHAEFELFCFQRWFILSEFMHTNNLETVFYQDSDVLLYADVNSEWKHYEQYDFTLVQGTCASNSYFKRDGLDRFCRFVMSTYEKRDKLFQEFESIYIAMTAQGLPGGICDMTLFRYYKASNDPPPVGEMCAIDEKNATWDHHLRAPDGYRMRQEDGETIKDVVFLSGLPHVYNLSMQQNIRFKSLHLQGQTKAFAEKWTKV